MMKPMDAYLVTGYRSPVGKAPKGSLRSVRPDDLAASVIRYMLDTLPDFDRTRIDDVVVGNATPEAEQGLNLGRMVSLMSLDTDKVPGVTVNRYCASGLETIAQVVARIRAGMGHCYVAGGVESMSPIPFGGWRIVPNYEVAKRNPDWYWGMGLTAEAVAREYSVSREDQDAFAFASHQKAIAAQQQDLFAGQLVPIKVTEHTVNEEGKRVTRESLFSKDEGPRADTSLEALARLKPVFDVRGSVTAGNSSQTSDGAAFMLVMSEAMLKETGLQPVARLVHYAVAGVAPRIMGMGPVEAVPRVLKEAGWALSDLDLVELNEAFASQSIAVMRKLDMDPEKVNVNGGAIALGHPLGCSGAKLTIQLIHELKRRGKRRGMVTMCVGTGQGAAGLIELC